MRVQNNRTDETVKIDALVEELGRSDVIFLGEQHDNDSGHTFQLDVIKGLFEKGHQVVISTEQFERDVQGAVDDYLSGRIDEATFLEVSRPWGNYTEHYRPIIEFAKEKQLPVLAANIPRRVASAMSQGKPMTAADQAFLPRSTSAPEDAYWDKFNATMQGHMGATGEEKMKQFYASQCLKDDAMAESITDYLAKNSHQAKVVVHLCGHFHSDHGLGTVARVIQRRPLTRFSVVTMELANGEGEPATKQELAARAHFTCWTVMNPETGSGEDEVEEDDQ